MKKEKEKEKKEVFSSTESPQDPNTENEESKSQKLKSPDTEIQKVIDLINEIKNDNTREHALSELSKKRESFKDLALYIWYSTGTVSSLLQEIISTYELLDPPKLTIQISNRVCNVLALFQCVAANHQTRPYFLSAQIPIFLYPFLNITHKTRPFEYLRLTALGVIGALVKFDNPEVISFLLNTEIIPWCLKIMERGSELSKTISTFIVQRILLDDYGLKYICSSPQRFFTISCVFSRMIINNPSQRLCRHIIRSYARLSDNNLVKDILKENIPSCFKDKNFINSLDDSSKKWMNYLNKSLNEKIPITHNGNNITMNSSNINNNINNSINNNMNMMIMNQQNFMLNQRNDFGVYGMYNNNNNNNANLYI